MCLDNFEEWSASVEALKVAQRDAKAERRRTVLRARHAAYSRAADRIDGYDRDDLGESPNF
jgi:hypothetical protein